MLQSDCSDAIPAILIFLHLLERQTERIAEVGLGHAERPATQAQFCPYVLVSWVCGKSWHRVFVFRAGLGSFWED
jgi:hypothetical protein